MYLDGPDHVTIEVQSAMHHDFTHVHLFSDDPAATAAWYQQHLGIATLTKLETVRAFRGIPTGPLASMQLDDLDATLVRLNQAGVRIVSGPRKAGGLRSAFIEAPDRMELEIVEGHAAR